MSSVGTRQQPALKYTDAQIEAALLRNLGNVTMAALELGCAPQTIRYRVNGPDRAKFAACRFEAGEQFKDIAELVAHKALTDGSESMARFVLARKAKDRGWGQSVELGGTVQLAPAPAVKADELEDDDREALRAFLAEKRAQIGG